MNYCKMCASDVEEKLNKDGNCLACADALARAVIIEKDIKSGKVKLPKSTSKKASEVKVETDK